MPWDKLPTRTIRWTRYDADEEKLDVIMKGHKFISHKGVLPHMYDALRESEEPEFYYKYYIQPLAVARRRTTGRRLAVAAVFLCTVGAMLVIPLSEQMIGGQLMSSVKLFLAHKGVL
ncbi:MAG: hypothetical protein DI589_19435 [Shinella sp.]|nr:MAG: hypothetical protein DI589_19435 [Shinella sp.]